MAGGRVSEIAVALDTLLAEDNPGYTYNTTLETLLAEDNPGYTYNTTLDTLLAEDNPGYTILL